MAHAGRTIYVVSVRKGAVSLADQQSGCGSHGQSVCLWRHADHVRGWAKWAMERLGRPSEFGPVALQRLGDLDPISAATSCISLYERNWERRVGYGETRLLGNKCFALRIAT